MPDQRASLLDDIRHAHNGAPWHGSSRAAILADVTLEEALVRPAPGAHSIFELVLHMTAWTREVARRVRSAVAREPEMGDWPRVPGHDARAWTGALEDLEAAHREIVSALAAFDVDRLDERLGEARDPALGTGMTFGTMLRGVVQHDAYHSGQIAIIKKIIRGRASA